MVKLKWNREPELSEHPDFGTRSTWSTENVGETTDSYIVETFSNSKFYISFYLRDGEVVRLITSLRSFKKAKLECQKHAERMLEKSLEPKKAKKNQKT